MVCDLELYTKIVPASCKLLIRKDRITLKLAKIHKENWPQLQPENKPAKPATNSSDPSAGLMDLMRDMYQSGDDNMKRVIAEAFVGLVGGYLSRQKHSRDSLPVIWQMRCELFVRITCVSLHFLP